MTDSGSVDDPDDSGGTCCKLGRNVREYDLGDLDAALTERHVDGASLRDLEQFVNEAILGHALRDAQVDVLGDVDAVYAALTGDDVSAGKRTETRQRLARAGVDVDALIEDFVSYQTVRTHLRNCLDVDTDRRKRLSVDDARGTIEWARSRSEGIVGRTIERLAATDEFGAGDVDVSHVIRVTCSDCGTTLPVDRYLDEGGCECDALPDDASSDSE